MMTAIKEQIKNLSYNPDGRTGCMTGMVRTKRHNGTLVAATSTLIRDLYAYRGFNPVGIHTMHVGLVILRARRKHNLSRAQFAAIANRFAVDDCKLTMFDVNNYEKGYASPKLDKAMLITAALKSLKEVNTPAEAMGYCEPFI